MQAKLRIVGFILLWLVGFSARAAHTQASLLLNAQTAKAGDTVLAGIRLRMDPNWHTYWQNSGASGSPTKITWHLPAGVSAQPALWPVPEKLPEEDLTTYIYSNEVVLLVPLKLSANLPSEPLQLKANVSWLECYQSCVPGSAEVEATLNIGRDTKPSQDATLLENWQKKLPQKHDALAARAWWEKAAQGDTRPLLIEWSSPSDASEVDFFPDGSDKFEIQGPTERIPAAAGKIALRKQVKKFSGDWPSQISGVLLQKSGGERLAFQVTMPVELSAAASKTAAVSVAPESLWLNLIYAFLGGLILNVMPCVLPVIALKILGFVGQAKQAPGRVRFLGAVYTLGVLVSFACLAAVVIGVKAAGHTASWGMQFASPQFIVVLTVLVTLVAMNLFGVFEVNPGSAVLNTAGELSSRHGPSGAFFNGVLATLLATPCTAPILALALGFAFLHGPGTILAIFLTVGFGLAFPYLILSWQPAWLRFLPRPGPWMQQFKVAMGFPMLATAVWLFSLTSIFYGKRTLWLGIFLVLLSLGAWVYGEFVQRGTKARGVGLAVSLLLLLGGYAYVVEHHLQWRSPLTEADNSAPLREGPEGIDWKPWSPEAVAKARSEGHPVFVDFTADWCLTCQANKRIAIEVPSVRSKLKQIGAVAFLGDYTRVPTQMTEELNRYGRAGVPLVLVYPKDPQATPFVLPEALTPGIVLDYLDRAERGG